MNRRQILVAGSAVAAAGIGVAAYHVTMERALRDYEAAAEAIRAPLTAQPALADLVRIATLAPNGHNAQPWRFRIGDRRIDIRPDYARRTPVVDPDDHHLFVSLGCAAETLALAAASTGRRGEARFDPAVDAAVYAFSEGPPEASPLVPAIARRQSLRAEYDGRPVAAADLAKLAEAGAAPGVALVLITEQREIERVLELVIAANTAQMTDPAFMTELKSWVRFSPRQAMTAGDGLFAAASGNPAAPSWLGSVLFDLAFRTGAENDKYARQLRSSAGVAVFAAQHDDKEHWFEAGRACQRFALQATALGLKLAFVNQPVEVPAVRAELANRLGLAPRRPDLVLRFGFGPALPRSLRRPVAAVIDVD